MVSFQAIIVGLLIGETVQDEFQDYSEVADGVKHCYVDGFAVDLNSGCAIEAYEINVGIYCCDDPDVEPISESLCVNCCPVECHAELAFWVDYVTTSIRFSVLLNLTINNSWEKTPIRQKNLLCLWVVELTPIW